MYVDDVPISSWQTVFYSHFTPRYICLDVQIVITRNLVFDKSAFYAAIENDIRRNNLTIEQYRYKERHFSALVPWASAIRKPRRPKSAEKRYKSRRSAAAMDILLNPVRRKKWVHIPPNAQKNPIAVPGHIPDLIYP